MCTYIKCNIAGINYVYSKMHVKLITKRKKGKGPKKSKILLLKNLLSDKKYIYQNISVVYSTIRALASISEVVLKQFYFVNSS